MKFSIDYVGLNKENDMYLGNKTSDLFISQITNIYYLVQLQTFEAYASGLRSWTNFKP